MVKAIKQTRFGNVGIRTNNPSFPLHVHGGGGGTGIYIYDTNAWHSALRLEASTANTTAWWLAAHGSNYSGTDGYNMGNEGFSIMNNSSHFIHFDWSTPQTRWIINLRFQTMMHHHLYFSGTWIMRHPMKE